MTKLYKKYINYHFRTISRFQDELIVSKIHFAFHESVGFFKFGIPINFSGSKWEIFPLNVYFFLFSQKLKTRIVVNWMMLKLILQSILFSGTLQTLRNSNDSLKVMLCDSVLHMHFYFTFLLFVILKSSLIFAFRWLICQV